MPCGACTIPRAALAFGPGLYFRLAVPLRGSAYEQYFRQRMRCVLYAAHAAGCSTIVLGAWGDGVFRNRPEVVAELWSEVLDALEWRAGALLGYSVCHSTWRARLVARRISPRASRPAHGCAPADSVY